MFLFLYFSLSKDNVSFYLLENNISCVYKEEIMKICP